MPNLLVSRCIVARRYTSPAECSSPVKPNGSGVAPLWSTPKGVKLRPEAVRGAPVSSRIAQLGLLVTSPPNL
jgi:hypothetical protein